MYNKVNLLFRLYGLLLPLSAALGLTACTDEIALLDSLSRSGTSALVLDASAADGGTANAATRFSVNDSHFSTNNTIGLYICQHEDGDEWDSFEFNPMLTGTNNIQCQCTNTNGTTWRFFNAITETWLSQQYITKDADGTPADLYAYAPYISEAVSPLQIPFVISCNNDLMYASENANVYGGSGVNVCNLTDDYGDGSSVIQERWENKNIVPETGKNIIIPLHFRHVLARIRFAFKVMYTNGDGTSGSTEHRIDSISIWKTGNKNTQLYASGNFNAITGELSDLMPTEKVTVTANTFAYNAKYKSFSSKEYTYFDFMLCPTAYQTDGDLEAEIVIDGQPYIFPLSQNVVTHGDGTGHVGFLAGYSYDYYFLYDDVIHLTDICIQEQFNEELLSYTI